MTTRRMALATATFLGLVCFGSVPAAAITTTFAGIECVEADDTEPEILYSDGKAFNDNESFAAELECPIDRLNSNVGGAMTNIHVRVDDSHGTGDLRCRVHSCNWSGETCAMSSTVDSANVGLQSIYLGSVPTYTNGYAYLSCRVPDAQNGRHSGVLSYRVTD